MLEALSIIRIRTAATDISARQRSNVPVRLLRSHSLSSLIIVLVLAAVASVSGGLPNGWRFVTPLPQGNDLQAAWAAGPNDLYAGGHGGVVLHWDGQVWTPMPTPTQKTIFAIHGLSGTNIWAVGGDAYAESLTNRSLILH